MSNPQDKSSSSRKKNHKTESSDQSNLDLHKRLEETDLIAIHEAFTQTPNKSMNRDQLRETLVNVGHIPFSDMEEFNLIFRRMNFSGNGWVNWDEFISYLIQGFQNDEISLEYKSLDAPIPVPPRVIRSGHRHYINRIRYYPTVKPDRSMSWQDGSLVTCSNDGVINYWSLDMQLEQSVQSKCPLLKISNTWVTDMVVLPDVSVICTSSTERDLRFYDTSARKFDLRVMFTVLDQAVTTMDYCFSKSVGEESKLILGDLGGSVTVIFIKTVGRGPFKSKPGIPLLHVRFDVVKSGAVEGFKVLEFKNLHTDYVRQVAYYETLHGIVSCSQCPKQALILTDITATKDSYVFKVPSGVWCFAIQEGVHIIASGGLDCLVRVWNPFVPFRPISVFYGHHAAVLQMTFQDEAKILYSLSKDKAIRVWDISSQNCLQNFLQLPQELGEKSEMVTLYNPEGRQWIIGSAMIAIVPLSPNQSSEHTDGNTHMAPVSVVLYNYLYKLLVTVGLDSYIIVWNPWDGRRMVVVKDAHTRVFHGEVLPVEITAACFDSSYQRLLTGAHDGSLKIWNFNTGTCLRNMRLDKQHEIASVIWVENRIMVCGWNRRVTEFSDTVQAVGPGGAFSKNWDLRHKEDISAAAVRSPQTLATCTYNGELILWRLETGQPYRKFNVSDPTTRIKITYKPVKHKEKMEEEAPAAYNRIKRQTLRVSGIVSTLQQEKDPYTFGTLAGRGKRVSVVKMPEQCIPLRQLAVHAMMFLKTRPMEPKVGTLLVSLENGAIQVWSHHSAGGFLTSFYAIHKAGDYIICMTSDENNEFLFTGTTLGYVKVWLLVDYCVEKPPKVCLPKYRLRFPFMWGDRFNGRAYRFSKNQKKPTLLSSFKGHLMPISNLIYVDSSEILISASADNSVRMWTLGGRYLQTVGTFLPWKTIVPDEPIDSSFNFSIPPDIKRVASSTTLRVLSGGTLEKPLTSKQLKKLQDKNADYVDYTKVYGKRLEEPFLGHYYKLPPRSSLPQYIEFDTSFPYIPVYQHLNMPLPRDLVKPNMSHPSE